MTAIGFDIAAQGGDLECTQRDHGRDSAVREAGRHGFDFRLFERRNDSIGPCRGGEVDIAAVNAEYRVAHATADKPRLDPRRRQRPEQALHHRLVQPRRIEPAHGVFCGSIWPGMISPFSTCGAT